MQKVKLVYNVNVLMGLYQMVKQSQFQLFLIQIIHLVINQFLIRRKHVKKSFLNEHALDPEDGKIYLLQLSVKQWHLPYC